MNIKLQKKVQDLMKKEGIKRVLSNFTWLSILQIVEKLIPIITIPYLIRVIGIEKWGLISFSQSFILYFTTIVGYGFHMTAVRDISINQENKEKLTEIFSSVLFTKILLCIVSFIIFISIIFFAPNFRLEVTLFLFNFIYVVGYTLFPDWFFQGMEKMKFSTILTSVSRIFFLLLIFVFIKKKEDYIFVPLLNSIGILFSAFLGLFLVLINFKISFSLPKIKKIVFQLKNGWNVFVSQLFLSLYANTRVFALGIFTTNTIVGYYAIAEKITNFLGIPLGIFANAVYPRISNLFHNNKERFFKIFNLLKMGSLFWGILLIISGYFLSPYIVKYFTGDFPNFEIKISLILLLLSLLFNQLYAFRLQYFVIAEKSNVFSKIYVISGSIGLLTITILSYFFSYIGTGISSIIIESLIFFLSIHFAKTFSKAEG